MIPHLTNSQVGNPEDDDTQELAQTSHLVASRKYLDLRNLILDYC